MNLSRYEWVSGPLFVQRFERQEFHHGKGQLQGAGQQVRLFVGQVRDKELGRVLNWAVEAPRDAINRRIQHDEYAEALTHAKDWTANLRSGVTGFPKDWTPPPVGAELLTGLII